MRLEIIAPTEIDAGLNTELSNDKKTVFDVKHYVGRSLANGPTFRLVDNDGKEVFLAASTINLNSNKLTLKVLQEIENV